MPPCQLQRWHEPCKIEICRQYRLATNKSNEATMKSAGMRPIISFDFSRAGIIADMIAGNIAKMLHAGQLSFRCYIMAFQVRHAFGQTLCAIAGHIDAEARHYFMAPACRRLSQYISLPRPSPADFAGRISRHDRLGSHAAWVATKIAREARYDEDDYAFGGHA